MMTRSKTKGLISVLLLAATAVAAQAQTASTAPSWGIETPESAYQGCKSAYEAQDYDAAALKCRRAAQLGSAPGENGLATLYLVGQGVPKNIDEAVKWFGKAAAQGDPQALNNLATLYFNGDGVAQDRPKAVALLRQAAAQGNAEAKNNLNTIYQQFPALKPK